MICRSDLRLKNCLTCILASSSTTPWPGQAGRRCDVRYITRPFTPPPLPLRHTSSQYRDPLGAWRHLWRPFT